MDSTDAKMEHSERDRAGASKTDLWLGLLLLVLTALVTAVLMGDSIAFPVG